MEYLFAGNSSWMFNANEWLLVNSSIAHSPDECILLAMTNVCCTSLRPQKIYIFTFWHLCPLVPAVPSVAVSLSRSFALMKRSKFIIVTPRLRRLNFLLLCCCRFLWFQTRSKWKKKTFFLLYWRRVAIRLAERIRNIQFTKNIQRQHTDIWISMVGLPKRARTRRAHWFSN